MTHDEPQMLLLVEDNPADARMISTALRSADSQQFTLVHVEQLSVALSWLEKKQFAVILLDLSLPDSWGLDTIKQIQTRAPHLPIVVMTGIDDEQLAINAVQEGAQDYLVKGQVEPPILMRALRYAIERHRLLQELQASEKRYYNLFENASDALLSFTLTGIITDVNHELEVLLGYSREEIIQQHYCKILTPVSTSMLEERIQ
jgi:DNA-binding NtrC family response regulator